MAKWKDTVVTSFNTENDEDYCACISVHIAMLYNLSCLRASAEGNDMMSAYKHN